MTKQDKAESKPKPGHASQTKTSQTNESHGGNSAMRNAASTQEAPAGVQTVATEDPYLKDASRPQQHELLKQNVQPDEGRKPQAHPAESDTPAGLHATGTKVEKKAR
jgi:hypothetical protein